MRTATPLVSIVLPVYNGSGYLLPAVASVIEQSFEDWELICIDDGSTDATPGMLQWFCEQDRRIRVVRQENQGIVAALNRGCALARGPLLARMDADDICFPNRLELQVAWFEEHPRCVAAGTAILEVDADSDPLRVSRLPLQHAEIEDRLLHRETGLFHPTVMMRAAAWRAVGGYRAAFQWVEDHDLWLRMARRGELANLPEILLAYRQHASSVCWQRAEQQRERMNDLLRQAYASRGAVAPDEVLHSAGVHRAAAGPGKWARAASKGGFILTACKHWRSLLSSDAAWSYKLRMSAEIALRSPVGIIQRLISSPWGTSAALPRLEEWHRRWAEACHHGQVPCSAQRSDAA